MKTNERGYNGWRNRETWLVSLWLDNDQPAHAYWLEQSRRNLRQAPESSHVNRGIWTEDEAARFNLADQLKREVTEGAPIPPPLAETTIYAELLSSALNRVDWQDIADRWIDELRDQQAEPTECVA